MKAVPANCFGVASAHRTGCMEWVEHTDGAVCMGCGTYAWDRLTPVEVTDGGEVDHVASPDCSPLCRVCSFKGSARIIADWPKVSTGELSDIWRQVREAQALDAAKMYETRAIAAEVA